MPWVYLDDGFPDHPKTVAAGGDAAWLFVCMLAWCRRYLTGGRIPKSQVDRLSDRRKPQDLARKLVSVGLLDQDADHYRIHDYEAWNESEDTQRQSRQEKARKAAQKRWDRRLPEQSPSNAQALPEQEPEQCLADAIPHPQPLTISSYSDSRPVRAPAVETETTDPKPRAELLTGRMVGFLARPSPKATDECRHLAAFLLEHLDFGFTDWAVGYVGTLNGKPRSAAYYATAIRDLASQRGVNLPEFRAIALHQTGGGF